MGRGDGVELDGGLGRGPRFSGGVRLTGRGLPVCYGPVLFSTSATLRRRWKFGPVPFRALVAELYWSNDIGSPSVQALPVWSLSSEVSDLSGQDMGGDHPIGVFGGGGLGPFSGFGHAAATKAAFLYAGVVLPRGDVYVGWHFENSSGGGSWSAVAMSLREVVVDE